MQSSVLVTGATGAVGPRVVQLLCESGYCVRTLSMDQFPANLVPDNVEARIGDVTDAATVQSAMADVSGVIHLAALLHIVNPPPSLEAKYARINVGGTQTVVESALRAGVERIVLFSTIAVYGNSGGQILTEDAFPKPDTLYAQTKVSAEQIVLNAERADGMRIGTVLRLGAVYGARIKGNYRRLLLSLAHRRFVPIGNGQNRRSLVYDKDIARAAMLALEHPLAAGRLYNVTDGKFHSLNEIVAVMCQALGRTPPRMHLPAAPARVIAGLLQDVAHLVRHESPIGRATVDKYTEDIAVDGSRIQRELGFVPQFGLGPGWRETVALMRQAGELTR